MKQYKPTKNHTSTNTQKQRNIKFQFYLTKLF